MYYENILELIADNKEFSSRKFPKVMRKALESNHGLKPVQAVSLILWQISELASYKHISTSKDTRLMSPNLFTLYITSDTFNLKNAKAAFQCVTKTTEPLENPGFDSFEYQLSKVSGELEGDCAITLNYGSKSTESLIGKLFCNNNITMSRLYEPTGGQVPLCVEIFKYVYPVPNIKDLYKIINSDLGCMCLTSVDLDLGPALEIPNEEQKRLGKFSLEIFERLFIDMKHSPDGQVIDLSGEATALYSAYQERLIRIYPRLIRWNQPVRIHSKYRPRKAYKISILVAWMKGHDEVKLEDMRTAIYIVEFMYKELKLELRYLRNYIATKRSRTRKICVPTE